MGSEEPNRMTSARGKRLPSDSVDLVDDHGADRDEDTTGAGGAVDDVGVEEGPEMQVGVGERWQIAM